MIQKLKEKIMKDRRIGRSSLEAFLEILKEVEAEYGKKGCALCYLGSPCEYQNEDVRIPDELMGWIPCSERLPKEPKENPFFEGKPLELYLVSMKHDKYPWRAFWNGKDFTDGWSIVQPEAWMPLPEAYQPTTD